MHVSVDTFSGAVYASAHAGEKASDTQKHLLQAFATLGVPKQLKTDNGSACISKAFQDFIQRWGISCTTGISHSPTGQAIVEWTHQTLTKVLEQQKGETEIATPNVWLAKALFTMNFLNTSFEGMDLPVLRHFAKNKQMKLTEKPPVLIRDPETQQIQGPFELITWGRGYACISSPSGLRWAPKKWVKPYVPVPAKSNPSLKTPDSEKEVSAAAWKRHQKRTGNPTP